MDGLYEQLRIALHQVWRRRWLALGVAWGVALVGWLAIALIPNKYESRARVFVQMQQILPSQTVDPTQQQTDLNRVKQTLTSTVHLEKIVRRTDLNTLVASERDLAAQVETLQKAIQVVAQPDNIFEISAVGSVSGFSNRQNAKLSSDVVQGLLDVFAEENLAGDREGTAQSLTFIDEELRRREQELQAAEQKRVEFEQNNLGLVPGEGSIGQRLSAARAELAGVEQQLIQAQGSLASLRGQLSGTPATIPGVGGVSGAASRIAALEAQLAQGLAQGWTDAHPDAISIRTQIDRLRPQAARERPGAGELPNPTHVTLRSMVAEKEAQAQAAQGRKSQLEADIAQLTVRQASGPGVAAEYARLNRDYDVLKRQYDKLLEDREQVRLRGDVRSKTDPVRFRVIDPPTRPNVPLTPNRPLLVTLVLFLAFGAGAGAAWLLAQLQATFPTQARLEAATGLPVLGTISEVFTDARRAVERQRLVWLGGGAAALGAAWALLIVVEFWQRSTVA